MSNLKKILSTAGLTFDDVLKTTVYVTDMSEYGEFNKVYVTYFKEPFSAVKLSVLRSCL